MGLRESIHWTASLKGLAALYCPGLHWESPSVLLATHKGSTPNTPQKGSRSAAASPAAGWWDAVWWQKGTVTCGPAPSCQQGRMSQEGQLELPHLYLAQTEPQSWPCSWSSSHSTQHCRYHCGHAVGRILGLWEAQKQERIAGSKTSWLWEHTEGYTRNRFAHRRA